MRSLKRRPQCPAAWTDENQRVWVDVLTYHVLPVLLQVTSEFGP